MKLEDSEIKKLIMRIAAGYGAIIVMLSAAIASLWGTVVYLHKEIVDDRDARIQETAELFEELGELKGSIAEVQRFGNDVLAEVNKSMIEACQNLRDESTDSKKHSKNEI